MAVRPLVTTGVALLSAGAVIAGTPALFVPRDEVTITASTVDSPAHRTLTQEQINLLTFTFEGLWHAYTQGYGAQITGAPADPNDPAVPGDCSQDGAVCPNGLSGAAYYFSDNVLPLGDLDNIYFEKGLSEFFFIAADAVARAIPDPTGRLDLPKRVDEYFHGFDDGEHVVAVGWSSVVYSIINDNLPDGGYGQGVNNAYFAGYGSQLGISAVVTYVVDAITQGKPDPDPTLGVGPQMATADEPSALLKAEPEPGSATSTSLPNVGKLLNLPTPKFKAPEFKAPVSPLGANLDVQGKVQEEATVDETVEGGTEGTPVVNEPTKPEAPKLNLPKLNLKLTPNTKLKEAAAEEESEDPAGSGVTSGAPNKFEPQILFGNKGKSTGGHNFLKDIDNAVKKFTGGGDEKSADGAGSDSNGDSSK